MMLGESRKEAPTEGAVQQWVQADEAWQDGASPPNPVLARLNQMVPTDITLRTAVATDIGGSRLSTGVLASGLSKSRSGIVTCNTMARHAKGRANNRYLDSSGQEVTVGGDRGTGAEPLRGR
jgi:hypothetical protein